jgi:hypothetical protein
VIASGQDRASSGDRKIVDAFIRSDDEQTSIAWGKTKPKEA